MSDSQPLPPRQSALDAIRAAMELLDQAETWPAFRASLEAAGLTRDLGAGGMQRLAEVWRTRLVRSLDNAALVAEMRVWAEGATYACHPDGFLAPPPVDLAAEAERRGWFVRALASGGWVVNPPPDTPGSGKPLTLPNRP